MSKYIEPRIDLNAFNCPHCGALADQIWFDTWAVDIKDKGTPFFPRDDIAEHCDEKINECYDQEEKEDWRNLKNRFLKLLDGQIFLYEYKNGKYSYVAIDNLFISKCFSCKKPSLWHFQKLLYPSISNEFIPNEDLNEDIKNDFKEAAMIYNLSPRGAAAILRLCVQKICKQVGEKGKNINEDIASLVQKGLDIRIQKALDVVRVVGNNAVHPGQIDLKDDKATAAKLFELTNLIAQTMITQPKNIDELFENLPTAAKEAINKRDDK